MQFQEIRAISHKLSKRFIIRRKRNGRSTILYLQGCSGAGHLASTRVPAPRAAQHATPPAPFGSAVVPHAPKMMDIEAAPVDLERAPLLRATGVETPAWRRRIAVGASIFGTVALCGAAVVASGEFCVHETHVICTQTPFPTISVRDDPPNPSIHAPVVATSLAIAHLFCTT